MDIDLVEKTTGGGSGNLNWTGSTANAIGTYVDATHICAQPNLKFNGNALSVAGTGVNLSMTDSTSPNLTLGLLSEVGGQLIDYGVNFCQLAPVNSGYSGGFFRMDMRPAYTCEFFNIKATTGNTEQTIFKLSREGNLITNSISATTISGDGAGLTGTASNLIANNATCLNGQLANYYATTNQWAAMPVAEACTGTATTDRLIEACVLKAAILYHAPAQSTNLGYTTAVACGTVTSSTGTNASIPVATTSLAGLMACADKVKLDGIATGAQVNVATNISITHATTSVTVNSSTGSNGTINAASASLAGVVTNAAQTFAGTKTTSIWCGSTCLMSPIVCASTSFRTTGAGYGYCGGTGCGTAVDWVATSDCRIKKNITPIHSALSMVDALCGVCYELCENNTKDMGLIAQDVFLVEPRLVAHSEPIEEYKKYGIEDEVLSLKYDKFAGLFVEAIKELNYQVIELKSEIKKLKDEKNIQ